VTGITEDEDVKGRAESSPGVIASTVPSTWNLKVNLESDKYNKYNVRCLSGNLTNDP